MAPGDLWLWLEIVDFKTTITKSFLYCRSLILFPLGNSLIKYCVVLLCFRELRDEFATMLEWSWRGGIPPETHMNWSSTQNWGTGSRVREQGPSNCCVPERFLESVFWEPNICSQDSQRHLREGLLNKRLVSPSQIGLTTEQQQH